MSIRKPGRRRLLVAAGTLALAATPWMAAAQTVWPTQTVKILVGFPGGSTPDIAARAIAEPLSRLWGQTVIVENRAGAGGNVAADAVAKSTDEHTLGVVINGNLTTAHLLNPRLPYDPTKDFTLLTLVGTAPLVLVTPPSVPSGAAWAAAARAAADKLSYGSVGVGSVGHLGMEQLKAAVGNTGGVHVPYKGNPAVITALIGGEIQAALMPPGLALPQAKAGKLNAVALAGPRSTLAPEVPALSEVGVNMPPLEVWTALVGPATLNRAAQERLSRDIASLFQDAAVRQALLNGGWEPQGTGAATLAARVRSETQTFGNIIRERGIKLE
jgi:tripartite-type tricarboxylate transporter receptor subunit TctC